jgi:RNA polymerase sigma-70 factor, ECF subfamily
LSNCREQISNASNIRKPPAFVGTIVEVLPFPAPPKIPAIQELFHTRGPWIYALVCRIVTDRAQAEQVVLEAFWHASQNRQAGSLGADALRVWLWLRARNLAIESLRSQTLITYPADFRMEYLKSSVNLQRISLALLKLAPHEREVFELAHFEGLSHSEIAALTGRSLGTVKTWVRSSRLRVDRSSESDQMQNEPLGAISVPSHAETSSI